MNTVLLVFLLLLLAKVLAEVVLDLLNRREVVRHARQLPDGLTGIMDDATYRKAVDYTLAKNRFSIFENLYSAVILAVIILSGLLPWLYAVFMEGLGSAVWVNALFIIATLLLVSLPSMPLEWWAQFRLEERFGFNKNTPRLWLTDKVKGLAIGLVIGFPLLYLLLALVGWVGDYWWVWGFVLFFAFQLVMMVLYPMLIMPLFNKFTPLPEGELRERLMELADRTGFKASTIQVMDGSRRSTHSNAFFTGFGRFRRIVLFDTLIDQLRRTELEAVLAHEIGHYKKGHIPRMLVLAAVMVFLAFWAIAYLANSQWFYAGFGFNNVDGSVAPAFLLFALLSGLVTFWLSPIFNILSRKHEYEADDFARAAMGEPAPLLGALRKLSEKNLSNLTPHRLYSGFYYSHPTLLERQKALEQEGI
jgi:STE24 endopeptidase